MKSINIIDAIRLAQEVSKLPDGSFTIAYYKYNRTTGAASAQLTITEGCKTRAQMPRDKWTEDGDNYFLFQDNEGKPKTAYRILIRFMGFPQDGYKLRKIQHT